MATSTVFALAFASAFASASSTIALSLLKSLPVEIASSDLLPLKLKARSIAAVNATPQLRPDAQIQPEFSTPISDRSSRPQTSAQLYLQRLATLQIGKLYTRMPIDSFREVWQGADSRPTYQQWRNLLAMESKAVSGRNSDGDLAILLGDSLSLWFPSERLRSSQIWLNQGISGDTTWNILTRLSDLENTRPSEIYLMAGVNDLKQGASDVEIVWNMQRIIAKLQAMHPNTKITIQSILPTRSPQVPNDRIVGINQQLKAIAQQAGITYLDVFDQFVDREGQISSEYTTDGIHLNAQGYAAWQSVLEKSSRMAAFSE